MQSNAVAVYQKKNLHTLFFLFFILMNVNTFFRRFAAYPMFYLMNDGRKMTMQIDRASKIDDV